MDTRINWFAALGGGLLYFMLGALWYSPLVFGPAFNEALGYAPGVVPPNTPAMFIGPLLGCLGASVGLALLIRWTRVQSLRQGLIVSLCAAGLFSLSAVGIDATAPNQRATLTFFCIVGGYHLVGQLLVGALVTRFRRT